MSLPKARLTYQTGARWWAAWQLTAVAAHAPDKGALSQLTESSHSLADTTACDHYRCILVRKDSGSLTLTAAQKDILGVPDVAPKQLHARAREAAFNL